MVNSRVERTLKVSMLFDNALTTFSIALICLILERSIAALAPHKRGNRSQLAKKSPVD